MAQLSPHDLFHMPEELDDAVTKHNTAILKRAGGRRTVHPPPQWVDYFSEQVQNFTVTDPKQMPLGIQKAMSELNGDGGGWISGGGTTGYYNDAGSFTEWPFYWSGGT